MRITPLDILQKSFPMVPEGFEKEEVIAFLQIIAEEMDELIKEKISLNEAKENLESQIKEYKEFSNRFEKIEKQIRDYKGIENLLWKFLFDFYRLKVKQDDSKAGE